MEKIKGVIFDFDGLMVKSEIFWTKAFLKACKKFNLFTNIQLLYETSGLPEEELRKKYLEIYPKLDIEKFREYCKNYVYKKTRNMENLSLKKGLKSLIEFLLKNNIKIAIASGNKVERIKNNLIRANVDINLFSSIIGYGVEGFKSKPCPDIYIISCKALNLKPEECIVLEDSYTGVRAGYDAGCNVIMVVDSMIPNEEMKEKTKYIVKNLNSAKTIIKNLIK